MISGRPTNTTRYLGAPRGWEPKADGPCVHLAIADMPHTSGNCMVSIWEPTPAELDRLNKGAKVLLTILGEVHPPVALSVGVIPE